MKNLFFPPPNKKIFQVENKPNHDISIDCNCNQGTIEKTSQTTCGCHSTIFKGCPKYVSNRTAKKERKLTFLLPYPPQKKGRLIFEKLMSIDSFLKARLVSVYLSQDHREVSTAALVEHLLSRESEAEEAEVEKKESGRMCVPYVDPADGLMHMVRIYNRQQLIDCPPNSMGIREPLPEHAAERRVSNLSEISAVLVPGIAFSPSCQRLGRGGGFYDRFLSSLHGSVMTIGLAFNEQLEETLPTEQHDRLVDVLVTPSSIFVPEFHDFLD